MAPAYTLSYFEVKGVAEAIRYLFHYGGIDFEDNRISWDKWDEIKPTTSFGQLPILEHNGKSMNQSVAISRYVAKQVKLTGKDDWEDLEIDALVDTIGDLKQKCYDYFYSEESKKEAAKEVLLTETLPCYFERFNKAAKNGYLVGAHLTWADLYFVAVMDSVTDFLKIDVLSKYPNLVEVRKNVESIPAIKAWIAERPEDKRP